jgi:hypothetical protein
MFNQLQIPSTPTALDQDSAHALHAEAKTNAHQKLINNLA